MKSVFARLLALVGMGGPATAKPRMIDPETLLFSVSTISDDMAPLEKVDQVDPSDLVFHEDEWRQVEFFDRSRLAEIQRKLAELKTFAASHQQGLGWSKVHVRELPPAPVVRGFEGLAVLEEQLGVTAQAGAVMFTGADSLVGRVANGFSLPLGGGVALYGFRDDAGVAVLGANVAGGGDDRILTQAFQRLSAGDGLILVDWQAQMILVSVATDGRVEIWRP